MVYRSDAGGGLTATAIAQKDKPQIDVVFTEIIVFMQGVERGIFASLNEKDIPNLPKMYDFAKIGDKGVAVVANVPVVFYREDMFKKAGWAPPTSFADLQRPELKGKIVIPGVNSTYGLLFLLELARLNGGDQYNIEPGFKALKAMAPGVVDWTNTYAKVGEMMESQEAAISVWGTTGAWEIIDRGVPAKIIPPNPLYLSMSAVGVMKGAPNPEGALALANWMMGDRHLAYRAERFGESPLNRETTSGGPHPERQLTRSQLESAIRLDHAHIRAKRAEWNERFAREIARQ